MKKLSVILLLLFGSYGCLNYVQEAEIYPDGSGRMKIHYWMDLPDRDSSPMIEKIGIFNPDSITNQFTSDFTKISKVTTFADSSDSTVHAIVELEFTHIDSISKTKAFELAQFSLKDGAAGQKIFSQFISPIATGFGIDGSRFIVTYKYRFFGDVITHNAHSDSGKYYIWSYHLPEIESGKTISVTFRPYKLKETPYWIYALMGAVIVLVLFFLFRRKKD